MITQTTESAGVQQTVSKPAAAGKPPEKTFAELLGGRAERPAREKAAAGAENRPKEADEPAAEQIAPEDAPLANAALRFASILVLPPASLTPPAEAPAEAGTAEQQPALDEQGTILTLLIPKEQTGRPETPAAVTTPPAAPPGRPEPAARPAETASAVKITAEAEAEAKPLPAPLPENRPAAVKPVPAAAAEAEAKPLLPAEEPALKREMPAGERAVTAAPAAPETGTVTVSDPSALLRPRVAQQVAERISVFAEEGIRQFEMTLHPERLGTVLVKMTIEAGRAVVRIETANPLAQQIIAGQTAELREILAQNGLQAESIHITYSGDGLGRNRDDQPERDGDRSAPGEAEAAAPEEESLLPAGALDYSI
ncbi:MAG: flagellar hook-length control protein FliK [Gracilibacteraceae bacterium]|jgi:flagellar hook-length control protein FliK|nr:flagellar hook-length control protein FliK [Gracilibacteraceae bacterium]